MKYYDGERGHGINNITGECEHLLCCPGAPSPSPERLTSKLFGQNRDGLIVANSVGYDSRD